MTELQEKLLKAIVAEDMVSFCSCMEEMLTIKESINFLIKRDFNVEGLMNCVRLTPFQAAIFLGKAEIVSIFLDFKDELKLNLYKTEPRYDESIIHLAVQSNSPETVELILPFVTKDMWRKGYHSPYYIATRISGRSDNQGKILTIIKHWCSQHRWSYYR